MLNPRRQGDLGELSAVDWLGSLGYSVYIPFGHSPDRDLVAGIDGRLEGVQVKTSSQQRGSRWDAEFEVEPGRSFDMENAA